MKPYVHLFSLLLLIPPLVACSSLHFVRVDNGAEFSVQELPAELEGADLLFMGEVHDIPSHHDAQLMTIKSLYEGGFPLVIGLEMFSFKSQGALDQWVAGTMSIEQFRRVYQNDWRVPWDMYADIFFYAREKGIPLVGINVPLGIVQKVSRQGFAALTAQEKEDLPAEISCKIDRSHLELMKKTYAEHGRDDNSFIYFCESQMLRNKGMAYAIQEYLKKNAGRTFVVIAGVGHSWRSGIPEQLDQRTNSRARVILPALSSYILRRSLTTQDADYLFVE